jgi:integrase/recombinase XerD
MEYLTKTEVTSILAAAKETGPREHFMFLAAYLHGLRASEIASLTLADVRGGKLRVQRLKGSLHSTQALEAHDNPLYNEQEALAALLADRGEDYGSNALFLSRKGSGLSRQQVRVLFKQLCQSAGVDAALAHPHALKHAICEHLRQAGVPVEVIRIRAGHRDVRATLKYFHVQDSEGDAAVRAILS